MKYKKDGIPVNVMITEIKQVVKHENYYGTYIDGAGRSVLARVIVNEFGVDVGDQVQGYILPNDPSWVYCYPSKELNLFLRLVGFGMIGSAIFCAATFRWEDNRNKKRRMNQQL